MPKARTFRPLPAILAFAGATTVFAIVITALFGEHGVVRHEALRQQTVHVERLNSALLEENRRLRREARALTSDPSYIEHTIRDELGWVHRDEVVFKFESAGPGID